MVTPSSSSTKSTLYMRDGVVVGEQGADLDADVAADALLDSDPAPAARAATG